MGITERRNTVKLKGKRALVTGGGRGIGRGISLTLGRYGADVALNYRKDESAARETVRELEEMGRKTLAVQADVTRPSEVEAFVRRAVEELGGLDIIAVNAGIASRGRTVRETDVEEFPRVIGTNLFGAFYTAKFAAQQLHDQGTGGLITFTSSVVSQGKPPFSGPYAAAKSGLEALMVVLAKEEVAQKIRVNAIAPGLVETEMGNRLVKARGMKDIQSMASVLPFGRVCQPEDIGEMVAFLASEAGSYITGQVIGIEGGSSFFGM